MKPTEVNVIGIPHKVNYVNNALDADIHGREMCWGQVDADTRTIRVYENKKPIEEVIETLFSEILHIVAQESYSILSNEKYERDLHMISKLFFDVLVRNKFINPELLDSRGGGKK